jgi:hypothetical protein
MPSHREGLSRVHLTWQTPGRGHWKRGVLLPDIPNWLMAFVWVFMLVYPRLLRRLRPRTAHLFFRISGHIRESSHTICKWAATLDLSLGSNWKKTWGLSNRPLSRWYQNPRSQRNSGWYRTSLFLTKFLLGNQSTHLLTRTTFHVPGALLQLFLCSALDYHQVPKGGFVMSQRRIVLFPFTHRSGLVLSSEIQGATSFCSTETSVSESLRVPVATVTSPTQEQISCELVELGPWLNGLTTMSSCGSCGSFWTVTIRHVMSWGRKSRGMEGSNREVAGYGSMQACWRMDGWMSMWKICVFLCVTYLTTVKGPKTENIHTVLQILTTSLLSWGFHGNSRKTCLSLMNFLSQVFCGTSNDVQYQSLRRRNANTGRKLYRGQSRAHIPSRRFRNCTANFGMHPWLSQKDACTSQAWSQCSGYSVTVLLCLAPHPDKLPLISRGGIVRPRENVSNVPSQAPPLCVTHKLIQTPAQKQGLQLLSQDVGELGASSQDGNQKDGTSHGLRPLASNSWLTPSSDSVARIAISRFLGTTEQWLKGGGTEGVGTTMSTLSSAESISALGRPTQLSIPNTLRAQRTQRTTPHVESTPPASYCSHQSTSILRSGVSLQTGTPTQTAVPLLSQKRNRPVTLNSPSAARTAGLISMAEGRGERTGILVDAAGRESRGKPRPYKQHLTPTLSHLCPHCFTQERLLLWRPSHPRTLSSNDGRRVSLSPINLTRIQNVMSHAWSESTAETYGSGLLVYHIFCDRENLPEDQRAPASPVTIASFVSSLAGCYSGKTLSNYFYGVRAWHILHGAPWAVNENEMDALLKAAGNLTPASSKRKQRLPFTPKVLNIIHANLNLSLHFDAAVWACLLCAFWSAARVGELTVRSLTGFDPLVHAKRSDIRRVQCKRTGLEQTACFIPKTKSAATGEDIFWAQQHGALDPVSALAKHFQINHGPKTGPLFAYLHKGVSRPLTKAAFLEQVSRACRAGSIEPLQGHGIRIGAVLEYLLRGVPFDVVKAIGHWASDAFRLYLRKHAQILAPYMQAEPSLHDKFVRYSMPPVR